MQGADEGSRAEKLNWNESQLKLKRLASGALASRSRLAVKVRDRNPSSLVVAKAVA